MVYKKIFIDLKSYSWVGQKIIFRSLKIIL